MITLLIVVTVSVLVVVVLYARLDIARMDLKSEIGHRQCAVEHTNERIDELEERIGAYMKQDRERTSLLYEHLGIVAIRTEEVKSKLIFKSKSEVK